MTLHTPLLISHLSARQILDSRGTPTLEVLCHLTDGRLTSASVPSGASTGSHEAIELRDKDPKKYWGQSVLKAVDLVTNDLSPLLAGEDPCDQEKLDGRLIEYDGTPQKTKCGGNSLLAVSLALVKAGARKKRSFLFQHYADLSGNDQPLKLPVPMFNLLNGGAHANMAVDFQEFMVVPNPLMALDFPAQLHVGALLTHHLKQVLLKEKLSTAIGDEGGFAPQLSKNTLALDLLRQAGRSAQHELGQAFFVAIDLAANTYYADQKFKLRDFPQPLDHSQYLDFLLDLIDRYPIFSLEDPFPESNWSQWSTLVSRLSRPVVVVGDDLLVTNVKRLQKSLSQQACTGIIIKPNQVGTVTETIAVVNLAKAHHLTTIFSHRSGETLDTSIADCALGCGADYVKFGAPVRGERVAKYNRLLRLFDYLNT